ncbi:MAG: TraB/GumN family protein [Bdellovibrionales bacterium]|nr:TraB/GumN family protein [Bdellovibrionales bacterium]
MKQIAEIKPNVDLVTFGERKFYLVGTAHVSKASAELVRETIEEVSPDVVCIELCEARLQSLLEPERWRETDIFEVVKSGRAYVLMAQLVLASFQKRLAEKFGVRPGEEMREAIRIGEEKKIRLEVVDREIRTTLKRAWAQAGLWSLIKLSFGLVSSIFSREDISEAEIEALKSGDALSAMMAEFADYLPQVKETLIDERDRYMAAKIYACGGKNVVAVVGAGHVPGIKRALGTDVNLAALEEIPPGNRALAAIGWSIPVVILAMFAYGFFHAGLDTSLSMIGAWIVITGTLSALGALVALAHPLTIVTAFVAAPITTLHPAIAAGWAAGLVEALIRKPRVRDMETIADDVSTIKGFWRNRLSKVLLVIMLSNLGSAAGMVLGSITVASLLG